MVPDIIQHTSISFRAERDRNEGMTAFNCGNFKAMLDLHYRHTVDDLRIVDQFWQLAPEVIQADKKLGVVLPTQQRVEWPSKAALKVLVWSRPLIHVAREIGVSNVALKEHCVKAGIDLPPAGYWIRSMQVTAR